MNAIQGSKYVQSDTTGIYRVVKRLADEGRLILFSGTPCQVAACKLYLGKNYSNVYYIDIICHGVPSLKMFQAYVNYLQESNNIDLQKVVFRDKSLGWDLMGSIIYRKNGKTYQKKFKTGGSSYYSLFLKAQTYRDSCYECRFACNLRAGDITIGDYWGIEKTHPEYLKKNGGELDENKGISCLLVNTDKGIELIDNYATNICFFPTLFEEVAKYNKQLVQPCKVGSERQHILNILNEQDYVELEKWFYRNLRLKGYFYKLYNLIPPRKID